MKTKGLLLQVTITALVAVMVLTMCVACGPSDNGGTEEGATVVTLYAQDFEDWSNEHFSKMVDEFNAIMDDGIQLEIRFFEDSAYTDALTSSRENNSAPDIFMCSYGNLYTTAIEPGYSAELDGLIDSAYLDDILDNVKEMVSYGNKYYAVPQLLEPSTLFFYRKDYFQQAGVAGAPETWTELLDACEKVKSVLRRGQYTIGLPIGTALGWATWGMQYNTAGSVALNDEWTEILVDSQGYRDLCGLFYDLYKGGYVPAGSVSPTGYNDIIEALCLDKLGMTIAGSWSIAEILNTYPEMADKIGVAPIPTKDGDHSKITATNGGWTYCISSTSQHKDLAAHVLEWFFFEDASRSARFFEAAKYSKSSTTKSVQEYIESNAAAEYQAWMSVVNDVASKALPEPTYSWDIAISVSNMFEYMALHCDEDKNTIIEQQIDGCVANIEAIMNRTGFTTNPKYN